MVQKFLSSIARPFSIYLEATVAEPCRSIYEHTKSNAPAMVSEDERFSLIAYIKKQRQYMSPELSDELVVHSVREHYLRKTGLGGSSLIH